MTTDDSLRGLARHLEEIARAHPRWSQVHQIVPVLTGYITALARIGEINQDEALSHQVIEFDYINWRANQTHRKARPLSARWGTSEWYTKPQWLLSCWDLEKNDIREFAIANMTNVQQRDRYGAAQ